ncbi:MAG: hypothetical protein A4E32_01498 [Methanomassiliicoccales archaeon PtaU1.Bin124]|nr:MAG: hypothetical protein A4E32_01498 [Methanomassiliicoccales archaeon PtaU1.Bin124]
MKHIKTADLLVSTEGGGGVLGDQFCMVLTRAAAKNIPCSRAGYVDCRNCNIPLLYEDVAKRIIMERQ